MSDPETRARLGSAGTEMGLSPAGAQAVQVALRMLDRLEAELAPVHAQITAFARRQPGCTALARELYGVGPLVAAIIWAFLGDARRFSSSAHRPVCAGRRRCQDHAPAGWPSASLDSVDSPGKMGQLSVGMGITAHVELTDPNR